MKAIVYDRYGSPDVLRLEEIDEPTAGDDEVLIRVHATSINSWDWDNLVGKSQARPGWGLFRPKRRILGADIAGEVAAIGKNVTHFRPGDEVFGDLCQCGWGGFAEYVCAPQDALALKSRTMTFEQAAAVPQAGGMALQGVRDLGRLQPGQKILINGAGGGVGTFAIQIAKASGAEVTGVDCTKKLDFMHSVGADHVIDYTVRDFVKEDQRYDLIIDVTAHRSILNYKRVLGPAGRYILIGGETARVLQTLLLGSWLSLIRSKKKMAILLHRPNQHLASLNELYESGDVAPVIDRIFPLSATAEAFRHYGGGTALGKVVVTV